MTNAEAVALIESSTPWQLALANGEGAPGAWRRWSKSNPLEAGKLLRLAGGIYAAGTPPTFSTKYGRGMADLVSRGNFALLPAIWDTPAPPPPPPPVPQVTTAFDGKGAFLVNANNASPDLLWRAGVTKVAHQITALGQNNGSTFANVVDLGTNRWDPFTRFGWGTHDSDVDAEVKMVKERVEKFNLKGYIADTEAHHLNGHPERTPILLDKLKAALNVPVGVITFAYGFSPGQLPASRYADIISRGCAFIGEAYGPARTINGFTYPDGSTWGATNVANYMLNDGAQRPLRLAIGDKSIMQDAPELPALGLAALWVWAAEQTGDTILALGQVAV